VNPAGEEKELAAEQRAQVTMEPLFSMPLVANSIRSRFGRRLQYAQFLNSSNAAMYTCMRARAILPGKEAVRYESASSVLLEASVTSAASGPQPDAHAGSNRGHALH
jgi:hypothetical protein